MRPTVWLCAFLMIACLARAQVRPGSGLFRDPASQFVSPTLYLPSAGGNGSVASADFNGDGKPDLAVAGGIYTANKISILLNNGNGTFTETTVLSVPDAGFVYTADLNHDGKADLIATDYDTGGIQVLLGNGDGTFQSPVFYSTVAHPFSVTVGDFNGDGFPDLIVEQLSGGGNLSLLLNKGDGTFGPATTLSLTVHGYLAAGDFNRDGKLDLAATNGNLSNTVSIYLGNGDGTFKTPVSYATGPVPYSVQTADLNHDGYLDLAISDYGAYTGTPKGDVAILLGNGDGSFRPATFYSAGVNPFSATLGDFRGDGNLGVAVADESNIDIRDVFVLFGNPDGTLQKASVSYALNAQMVLALDLNGDGKADLVSGGPDNSGLIGIALNAGNDRFNAPANYFPAVTPYTADLADLNGDGNLDIVSVGNDSTGNGIVSTLLGRGNGTFPAKNTHSFGSGGKNPFAVKAVDLNGDGKPDLAISHSLGGISIFMGNGDGTFVGKGMYGNRGVGPFVVADFNGDGIPDLALLGTSAHTVEVFFGNGDATFRAGPVTTLPGPAIAIATSDLNRDGKADLVLTQYIDKFFVVLGNGDGTFSPGTSYVLPPDYFVNIVIADFNHDGIPDIGYAGVNAYCDVNNTGDVGYLLGNGDGTFGFPYHRTSPDSCPGTTLAVGDFNGDGILDLIETDGGSVGLMLGQGGNFEDLEYYPAGFSSNALVGDVNNDGAPDLVTLNSAALTVLLNASGVRTTLVSSPNPSVLGQTVSLVATVSASTAFQPVPTGTVTFKDGGKVLGTVTLSSGQATFATSAFTAGKHIISAVYSGDGNFIAGYPGMVLQTVN